MGVLDTVSFRRTAAFYSLAGNPFFNPSAPDRPKVRGQRGFGGQYQIYADGGNFITLTAAPEPGTLSLLGLAYGGYVFRRLRKRRAA